MYHNKRDRARGGRVSLSKILALSLGLTALPIDLAPFASEPTRLDIPEARALAVKLMQGGQPHAAKKISEGLLKRDPKDITALLVLSRSERLLNNYPEAAKLGKTAWRNAEKPQDKFNAALLTAQAVSAKGNRIGAQVWLRRAAQAAPNDRMKAVAVRDLRFVRATTPLSVDLTFAVTPSSNINNGSISDTMTLGGLSFLLSGDARALSGLETRVGAKFGYRFPTSTTQTVFAEFGIDTRSYALSSSAKAQAPDVRGSDYNFQEVHLTFGTQFTQKNKNAVTVAGTIGQNWYGGNTLTRFARVYANQRFQLSDRSTLDLNLTGEQQWRQDNSLRDAFLTTVAGTWSHRLDNGSFLSLTGYVRDTASDSANVANATYGAALRFAPGDPIFSKTRMELSLGYQVQDYDKPLPLFGLREDRKISASATFFVQDIEYFGFSPTATVNASRNNSNQSVYETEEFGVSLGLRSSF